jgi:hypothetical protein
MKDNWQMKDNLLLAVRFSYVTSCLQYCGPSNAPNVFRRYLEQGDNEQDVRNAFTQFEGLYAYLSVLAEKTGKDFLDGEVVEAYWLGNSLLDRLDDENVKEAIHRLSRRGLPQRIAEERTQSLPTGMKLHHDFNVLYMGVGLTSGKAQPTLPNMENCRVSWGRVLKVRAEANELEVLYAPLRYSEEQGYSLGVDESKTVRYEPQVSGAVREGDHVAMHWGFVATALTEEQLANLKKYTAAVREKAGLSALIK